MPIDAIDIDDELLLGRYRVLETRGRGGFGTVSVCWDPRLMRRVAIKSIELAGGQPVVRAGQRKGRKAAPGDVEDQQRRARLLDAALAETRTASMLSHPNIVQMLDFESDDDRAYIIMEYVEGASLSELLDSCDDGTLTKDEAAAVVEAVCDALQFAHDNGVLHLDIKPDNILIEASGRVKLADFGMAALSSATGYTGARGGTVGYMPPEQIEGGEVDVRTDVFAVGCVMYEALTGVRPFNAPSIPQSLELVLQGAADPCALNENLSETCADALLVAIDADPDMRQTSAAALSDELMRGLGRPKAGRRSLANFVAEVLDDSYDREEGADPAVDGDVQRGPAPQIDAQLFANRALRGVAGLGCAALAGLAVASATKSAPAGVAVGIAVMAAGVFAPQLSGALAVVALVLALAVARAWLLAALCLIAGALWWALVCRTRPLASAPTLLGVIVPQFATPVPMALAGLFLPPGAAALSGAFAFAAQLGLCALAGSASIAGFMPHNLLLANPGNVAAATGELLTSLSTWALAVGWTGGAAAIAALCNRDSTARCYLGCLAGLVVFGLCAAVGAHVENGGSWWGLQAEVLAALAGSTILGALTVYLLGTPRALDVDGADAGFDTTADV